MAKHVFLLQLIILIGFGLLCTVIGARHLTAATHRIEDKNIPGIKDGDCDGDCSPDEPSPEPPNDECPAKDCNKDGTCDGPCACSIEFDPYDKDPHCIPDDSLDDSSDISFNDSSNLSEGFSDDPSGDTTDGEE